MYIYIYIYIITILRRVFNLIFKAIFINYKNFCIIFAVQIVYNCCCQYIFTFKYLYNVYYLI